MNHATGEQWQHYAEGKLEAAQREELEAHLYECEICLNLYSVIIEASLSSPNEQMREEHQYAASEAADRIMAKLRLTAPLNKRSHKRNRLIRHPLFQYTVAAAITMLLLTTGVFHNIGKITPEPGSTGNSSPPRQEQPSNSFSQRLMERTTTLLDHLQPNRQEGGQSYE